MTCRVDTAPHEVERRLYSLTADWPGSGIRAAPPREDRVPCPFRISWQTGSTQPRMVWEPCIHTLVYRWLAAQLAEPEPPGENVGQIMGGGLSDAPDEDRAPSPFQKSFHPPSTPTNRGQKTNSTGSKPHRTVWNFYPKFVYNASTTECDLTPGS